MTDKVPPEGPPTVGVSVEGSDPPIKKLSRRQRQNKNRRLFRQLGAANETPSSAQGSSSLPPIAEKNPSRVGGTVPGAEKEAPSSKKGAGNQAAPEPDKEELARLKYALAKRLFGMEADRHKWFPKQPVEQKVVRPGNEARRPNDRTLNNGGDSSKGRATEKERGSVSKGPMWEVKDRRLTTAEIREDKVSPREEALLRKRKSESIWSYSRVNKSSKEIRQWFLQHLEPVELDEPHPAYKRSAKNPAAQQLTKSRAKAPASTAK